MGYGNGALRAFDAATGDALGDIKLSSHPESFQLEAESGRTFVNVPNAGHIAVLDRLRRKPMTTWKLNGASGNFPMALDEAGHRLFVGVRRPAQLLVYDTETGKPAARIAIGGDTDDLFFDPSRKRVYTICGEGVVNVVQQAEGNPYTIVDTIRTAPGARTGLFVPALQRLYVAVPARNRSQAEVRAYAVH